MTIFRISGSSSDEIKSGWSKYNWNYICFVSKLTISHENDNLLELLYIDGTTEISIAEYSSPSILTFFSSMYGISSSKLIVEFCSFCSSIVELTLSRLIYSSALSSKGASSIEKTRETLPYCEIESISTTTGFSLWIIIISSTDSTDSYKSVMEKVEHIS